MDVGPTVEAMKEMARTAREFANWLDFSAGELTRTEDWSIASEVINRAVHLPAHLRLDLMVTRPLREFQRTESEEHLLERLLALRVRAQSDNGKED